MPILVGPQHMAGLVTWTVATGVARKPTKQATITGCHLCQRALPHPSLMLGPHSGISKLKVPTDENSNEFVDLHMLEPFAQELETLPLDTLVFQEPGENVSQHMPPTANDC